MKANTQKDNNSKSLFDDSKSRGRKIKLTNSIVPDPDGLVSRQGKNFQFKGFPFPSFTTGPVSISFPTIQIKPFPSTILTTQPIL
jgi:hypothetical protein